MSSFFADPYHCAKAVVKNIFSIVNDGKSQRCGYTKADSLRINKYLGYMINKNRNKYLEDLQQASKVPLEHMFNNNGKCIAERCFNTISSE